MSRVTSGDLCHADGACTVALQAATELGRDSPLDKVDLQLVQAAVDELRDVWHHRLSDNQVIIFRSILVQHAHTQRLTKPAYCALSKISPLNKVHLQLVQAAVNELRHFWHQRLSHDQVIIFRCIFVQQAHAQGLLAPRVSEVQEARLCPEGVCLPELHGGEACAQRPVAKDFGSNAALWTDTMHSRHAICKCLTLPVYRPGNTRSLTDMH